MAYKLTKTGEHLLGTVTLTKKLLETATAPGGVAYLKNLAAENPEHAETVALVLQMIEPQEDP